MRSASTAAALLVLLFPVAMAAGGALAAGQGAGAPDPEDLPLLVNISLPERTLAARAWYERGFTSTAGGRYSEAATAYRNALVADPSDLNSWYYLGDALFRLGRYEDALLAFRNATAVDPDFVDAYFYEGRVYRELGMPREEEDALARGLEAADRRIAAGEAGTPATPVPVSQPLSPIIAILATGAGLVLLKCGRRDRDC